MTHVGETQYGAFRKNVARMLIARPVTVRGIPFLRPPDTMTPPSDSTRDSRFKEWRIPAATRESGG
jgi:hypothetical protein